MIRTLCLKRNLLSFHFSNCILTLFCISSQLVFLWSFPNHIPNTFTLSFTSWCICGWLMVSGLPFFRISVFCSFVLCFPWFFSVSNCYFTSQYHQCPLSHPAAAAAAIYPRAATAAAAAVEIPSKTRYKQKQNETHYENTTH